MLRHLILSIYACTVLGILGCSQQPDQMVSNADAVTEGAEPDMELPPGESLAAVTNRQPGDAANGESLEDPVGVAETPPDAPPERPAVTVQPEPSAETVSPEPPESEPSPAAAASVVQDVTAFYGALDSIRVMSEVNSRVVDDRGLIVPNTAAPPQIREVLIQRPNRFSMRGETDSLPIVASDVNQLTA